MKYYCDRMRHLICIPYTVENLHQMARDLGIKRCWYDPKPYPHYDIPKKRIGEIQQKCNMISPKQLVDMIRTQNT